jgi:uncharacterized membrane protein YeaQ/YmgE (transglycosylase-associated protein family)
LSVSAWIIFGGLAGWIASRFMREHHGCLMNVLIGVLGAMLGGFLFTLIGQRSMTGFDLWSLFVAVIGAAILIAFFRAIRGPRHYS